MPIPKIQSVQSYLKSHSLNRDVELRHLNSAEVILALLAQDMRRAEWFQEAFFLVNDFGALRGHILDLNSLD